MDEMKNEAVQEQQVPAEEQPAAEKPAKNKPKKKDNTQVEALKAELAALQDQHQRMLAEYANYKRRTDQEKEQLGTFVKGELFKALLPAIDNLERAVASPDGEEYKKGIDMVIRQMEETLTSLGLEAIPALGEIFDPELHNAVMREDADGVSPETVTEVYQKGYRLGTRVLRPAMVKVAN